MDQAQAKAQTLTEALPYIRQWAGKRVVVKAGGETVDNEGMLDSLARDIAIMHVVGLRPILVHGGGRQISRAMAKAGRQPQFVDGRRVTDAETIGVVQDVLTDINGQLVAALRRHGADAVGLSGTQDAMLATRRALGPAGEDLGFVGEVEKVNTAPLDAALDADLVPVIAPVGAGPDGPYADGPYNIVPYNIVPYSIVPYNINADLAASAVAVAAGVQKIVLLTNVAGLYADLGDADSLISQSTAGELEALLAGGTLTEGMIPKITAVIGALRHGVPQAHILDGRVAHALLLEVFTDEGVGTMVLP